MVKITFAKRGDIIYNTKKCLAGSVRRMKRVATGVNPASAAARFFCPMPPWDTGGMRAETYHKEEHNGNTF